MWTVARDYEPLTRYLKGRSEPVIELTFTELDRLVEGGLPGSARRYQAWWANSRVSQRHSTYWLDAGRQAAPDFNAGRVRFTFGGEVRHGPNLRTLGRGGAKASRSSVGAGRGGQVTRRLGSAASLSPTGEVTQAVVRVGWLDGGAVSIEGGKPMTAGLPAEPGLYRFSFLGRDGAVDAVYVGETDNLARRMGQYRNPGAGQQTNLRLRDLVVDHLGSGGQVTLVVATEVDINSNPADFHQRPVRLLAENAALVDLAAGGFTILNR